ncbi:MAG: hypothetical protein ACK443_00890, partial [Methylococcaceae bacterium]
LLRREKLYHAQLGQWRKEFAECGIEGLSKSAPGPKPALSAEAKRIAQLEKENKRLQVSVSTEIFPCVSAEKFPVERI